MIGILSMVLLATTFALSVPPGYAEDNPAFEAAKVSTVNELASTMADYDRVLASYDRALASQRKYIAMIQAAPLEAFAKDYRPAPVQVVTWEPQRYQPYRSSEQDLSMAMYAAYPNNPAMWRYLNNNPRYLDLYLGR